MEKEIELQIKIKINGIEIDEEHTMKIDCGKECVFKAMIISGLDRFYKNTKAKLLTKLKTI